MSMKSIAAILYGRSKHSPLARGVESALVVETANTELRKKFGPDIVNSAQAVYFKNRTLTVACLSSTAAQEIKLREIELVDAINTSVGSGTVLRVQYQS